MRLLPQATPHNIALLTFLAFYLILFIDIRHWSRHDPSSVFFDPKDAFERKYSSEREHEANAWLAATKATATHWKAGPDPKLCVGIPTVQRTGQGQRYFPRLVGSLLEGLESKERDDVWLVSFIADVEPQKHDTYKEAWLGRVSDEILTYDNATEQVRRRVKELESVDWDFNQKPLVDYSFLLERCYAQGAPWVMILEDDTIAMDGWYYRTTSALKELEVGQKVDKMLYLRLFYNEVLLGWNSEQWPTYLTSCLLVEALIFGVLVLLRRYFPTSAAVITPRTRTTIVVLLTPMFIVLYFLAGRLTVSPYSRGLHRMDTYGCCSQALGFPHDRIPDLIAYYTAAGTGKIDALTEKFADERGLGRWMLAPSIFAHVGGTSSKPTHAAKWGRTHAQNIWNFGFELYDKAVLRKDHGLR